MPELLDSPHLPTVPEWKSSVYSNAKVFLSFSLQCIIITNIQSAQYAWLSAEFCTSIIGLWASRRHWIKPNICPGGCPPRHCQQGHPHSPLPMLHQLYISLCCPTKTKHAEPIRTFEHTHTYLSSDSNACKIDAPHKHREDQWEHVLTHTYFTSTDL